MPQTDPMTPQPCLHPKLQLQQIVPDELFERGDIGAWYKCERCGQEFRTDLTPYKVEVQRGRKRDDARTID